MAKASKRLHPRIVNRNVGVKPGTMAKLVEIKAFRRWPFTEAIDVMADRELRIIAEECSMRAAGAARFPPQLGYRSAGGRTGRGPSRSAEHGAKIAPKRILRIYEKCPHCGRSCCPGTAGLPCGYEGGDRAAPSRESTGVSAAPGEAPLKQREPATGSHGDLSSPGTADAPDEPVTTPASRRAGESDRRHAPQGLPPRSDEAATEFDSAPRCAGCGRPTDDDGRCGFCAAQEMPDEPEVPDGPM